MKRIVVMGKASDGIFQEEFVLDLSFFNFENAVTATFCDPDSESSE